MFELIDNVCQRLSTLTMLSDARMRNHSASQQIVVFDTYLFQQITTQNDIFTDWMVYEVIIQNKICITDLVVEFLSMHATMSISLSK